MSRYLGRLQDAPMGLGVEVLRDDHLDGSPERRGAQKARAEDGRFGVDVVGWYAAGGEFKALAGTVPGSVKLVAKSIAQRASYEWQYSTDQKTWTNAPATLQAKTATTGLPSTTMYYFRLRGVTKAGEGAYSQVVQILVP
jgi:hypothetical protein